MPEATRSPRASNETECTEGGYLVSVGNLSGKFILSSTSISIETPANGAYRSKTRRGGPGPAFVGGNIFLRGPRDDLLVLAGCRATRLRQ